MKELTLPEDVEMPLEEHLIELGRRFLFAAAVIAALTIILFPFSDSIIKALREDLLPPGAELRIEHPTEYLYMRIEVSIISAFLLALPLIIYQLFSFMRPGLYPSERKFFIRVMPGSMILLFLGAIFSYFIVTPFVVDRLYDYTENVALVLPTLIQFVSFVYSMLLLFGMIFQMPLVISFLVMGNLVTIRQLTEKRMMAYALLFLAGVMFTPDPVFITPFIAAAVLVVMYEISIVFAKAFAKA